MQILRQASLPHRPGTHSDIFSSQARHSTAEEIPDRTRDSHVQTSHDVRTLFLVAAYCGDTHRIHDLLKSKAVDVDSKDSYGSTALHLSSARGHASIVNALLPQADLSARDADGRTALHLAAAYGHQSIVAMLLGRDGVNVDEKDNAGRTPLQLAVMGSQVLHFPSICRAYAD